MARPAKINFELVEKIITELITNRINGDKFPKFVQIIKKTGGNSNTLRDYIKQYKLKYNLVKTNSIPVAKEETDKLLSLNKQLCDLNAELHGDIQTLNIKIEQLSNQVCFYKTKCETLENEISEIKNNEQREVKFLRQLLENHLQDFTEKYETLKREAFIKEAYDEL